jgi:hypothetical protein
MRAIHEVVVLQQRNNHVRVAELLMNHLRGGSHELRRLHLQRDEACNARDERHPLVPGALALVANGIFDGDGRVPRKELQRSEVPLVETTRRTRANAEEPYQPAMADDGHADDRIGSQLRQRDVRQLVVTSQHNGFAARENRTGEAHAGSDFRTHFARRHTEDGFRTDHFFQRIEKADGAVVGAQQIACVRHDPGEQRAQLQLGADLFHHLAQRFGFAKRVLMQVVGLGSGRHASSVIHIGAPAQAPRSGTGAAREKKPSAAAPGSRPAGRGRTAARSCSSRR